MTKDTLLRLLYECIQNPQKRNDFLAAFAEIVDASAAGIALEDRQLRWSRLYLTHGMDRQTIDSYGNYYVGLNPWAGRRIIPTVGEVRSDQEILSVDEFRNTEFFHGLFEPQGWLHASSVIFETSETERTYLFSMRPPDHPFTEKELAILKEIAPHLTKAAGMARRNIARWEIDQHRVASFAMDTLIGLNLTVREAKIALALVQSQRPKEIAYSMGQTLGTAQWHIKNIYKKLSVSSRADLVRVLLERGKK